MRLPGPRSARVVAWLAAATVALGLLAGASAQSPPRVQAPLDALVAPLFHRLAAMKGMAAPGPPPPVVTRSRQESRRFIEQELDRRYSPARIAAEQKALVAWGLIPADYELRRLFLDLMQEQIAAYYDPRAKVMVVGDWLTPEVQQAALVHELVHALQDRQMSLDRFMEPTPGRGDQLLARQALVEGEAVALMLDFMLSAQGRDLASLPDLANVRDLMAAGSTGPVIDRAPPFLRALLLFPYSEGLAFVHRFRRLHPWRAIADLYRDPPRSSAQILHPDTRLVSRRDPIAIRLPDPGGLLPGLTPVTEDELGEFALGAVLGQAVGTPAGQRAALGWRGDRFRLWEDRDGRLVLVYLAAFESEDRARDAARALEARVGRRWPALAGAAAARGALTVWADGPRVVALERRGAEVLLIEQAPAAALDALRDALWRSRPAGGGS
jgi:hypothetical protein